MYGRLCPILVIDLGWSAGAAAADGKYDPGVSDTEIQCDRRYPMPPHVLLPRSVPHKAQTIISHANVGRFGVFRKAIARKPATTDLMSRGGGFAPPHCSSRTESAMSSGTQRARCLVSVSAVLASRRRSAPSLARAAAE